MEVLNLRKPVVRRYWEEKNEQFSKLCNVVEDLEFWCNDDKDVEEALQKLADVLDGGEVSATTIMDNSDLLFEVMAYIKFSKALRLVTWFDDNYKENLSQGLINLASAQKDKIYHRLMLERLMLVKDLSLLQQIYSQDRLNKVKSILEDMKEKGKV